MGTVWYVLVAFMLTTYAVLDGFDLGAGALHFLLGRSDGEKRTLLAAVGPVWDGNEVWLIAAGGTLYFTFPAAYAAGFSGFYLPLNIALWLLILRGCGIEFRSHIEHPLWHAFFDFIYSVGSLLLALVFGLALGNILRGVPLKGDGFFFEPLWTTFTVTPEAGILDWFTLLSGLLTLFTLAAHGANYIAVKTAGDLNARARHISTHLWWGVTSLTITTLIAAIIVRPSLTENYKTHPLGLVFPAAVILSLAAMAAFRARNRDLPTFLSSAAFILSMLGGAAFALHPYLLPACSDPKFGISIHNAAVNAYGQRVGLSWWLLGMALALSYFALVYHHFRGKVQV